MLDACSDLFVEMGLLFIKYFEYTIPQESSSQMTYNFGLVLLVLTFCLQEMFPWYTHQFLGLLLDDIHDSFPIKDAGRPRQKIAFQLHTCRFSDGRILWINKLNGFLLVLVTSTEMCISLEEISWGLYWYNHYSFFNLINPIIVIKATFNIFHSFHNFKEHTISLHRSVSVTYKTMKLKSLGGDGIKGKIEWL